MIVDEKKENKAIAKQYKELLRISYQTLSAEDKKLIRVAFDTAVDAHKNQRRKSGEAYIFHPISVAKIVAEQIGLDATSIAAALLHDVVEDTHYSLEEIEQRTNPEVAKIVQGLTKISNLKKDKDISLQAENFRKMLLTLNDDIRVIIIKIADRLHNMTTLEHMPDYKRVKIASETLFIYAPLAHRIGLYNIKTELEDYGLKYTDPERYESIKNKIEETKEEQTLYIDHFASLVRDTLNKEAIRYEIQGRSKSIFSIHQKMLKQSIPFEKVYDKFAIRIIYKAQRRKEKFFAWKIYSILTDHFVPNPTRLRDWITAPKSTGYEALHVTVMGPENRWIEVQIRSERMHEIAEKGYAAHFKYKQGPNKDIGIDEWLDRLREILEANTGNAVDFVRDFKLNLYAEEIFIFTPQGELKSLPKGATALDFAFHVHTEIGMKTRGARVNGKLVPLSRVLKSGDQVEVITSENVKPTANWINFVQTSRARTKIKSSLNDEKKQIAQEGKEILRRKLKQLKIIIDPKKESYLMRYFKTNTSLDLYYMVGAGTIDNAQLKEFANHYNSSFLNFFKKKLRPKNSPATTPTTTRYSKPDKLVFGKDHEQLEYTTAPCCGPIPGDDVFGFITINEGIKVHKKDCPNAVALNSNYAYRIISAHWVDESTDEFRAKLLLTGIDNVGLVSEVTKLISNSMNVNILSISFTAEDGIFEGKIDVSVKNKTLLNKLVQRLSQLKGIEKVSRY